ncbi:MAG: hypothetical protein IIZ28_04015 [Erysipelotrichaceae bacterium]|nr:hypothetical protein [Erysipelotrichaceae bacterium]
MNHLLAENNTSNFNLFLYVIAGAAALIFLFRAAVAYPRYKKSIFPHIYDNYLIDYFYKRNVLQDSSRSGLLKKLLGYHRIVFANLTDKEGKLCAQIMTIIHSKGLLAIAYLASSGNIYGSDAGNWYVKRTEDGKEKKYKLENPVIYLREYLTHLNKVTDGKKVQSLIAVSDGCDLSNVKCSIRVKNYSEVTKAIEEADCGYGLNDGEIDEIFEKLGGRIDRR